LLLDTALYVEMEDGEDVCDLDSIDMELSFSVMRVCDWQRMWHLSGTVIDWLAGSLAC
jgi:hypothetical protein